MKVTNCLVFQLQWTALSLVSNMYDFFPNRSTSSFLAKYGREDNGGNEDGAEDDPGLGDGDSLGQGLGGVEGSDEGEGDPRDEDRPADQHQVDHSLGSHHRYWQGRDSATHFYWYL